MVSSILSRTATVVLTGFLCASCASIDPSAVSLKTPDLAQVADGQFVGQYELGPVFTRVEVGVKDHKITRFTILEHRKGLGGKAEALATTVVERQSVELDAVAGATASSVALLKAGELALVQGLGTAP